MDSTIEKEIRAEFETSCLVNCESKQERYMYTLGVLRGLELAGKITTRQYLIGYKDLCDWIAKED